MASPPLQVEDQTDENFFDILVDEGDTGISRSGPSLFENEGSDETNAFSKLSIGEADAAKVDSSGNVDFGVNSERESGGGTVSASLDGHGDNLIAEESVSLTPVNVVQSNDVALQEKCELDSKSSNNSGSSGMGVKEVDWSSFNSASHLHNGSGTGSFSDFFNELGSGDFYGKEAGNSGVASNNVVGVPENMAGDFSSLSSIQHKEGQNYGSQIEQAIDGQDLNSSQYWENLYPGWRFDPNTGQWHQLDGYNATMDTQQNLDASIVSAGDGVATEQRSDDYYFQQTAQSVLGNVDCRASSFTDWNQGSQQNVVYPAHMVFDPQYPGWYYDTIAQEWQLLESYTSAMNQPTNVHHNQQSQDGIVSAADFLPEENHRIHGNFDQVGKFESQDRSSQGKVMGWAGSVSDSNQQRRNTWKTASLPNSGVISISDNYESHNPYDSSYHATNSADQQNQQMWFKPSGTATLPEQTSQSFGSVVNSNSILGSQTFIPAVNFSQHSNQHKQEPSQQMHFSPAYFDSQKLPNFLQQPLGTQFPHASSEGRSSAGRPYYTN